MERDKDIVILMEMQGAQSSQSNFEERVMELTLSNVKKGAKDPNRHFSREGTHRANRHTKGLSITSH